ncbi:hypothetical protein M513_07018 [Trichuris suis]|uniref:Uncharacterized protein n=1 Tax=Trichuris suis TaxID=68888 RepID=A0A085M490_9BILA|nr:hypothetical protein M513_07018 [Trichuris suis]
MAQGVTKSLAEQHFTFDSESAEWFPLSALALFPAIFLLRGSNRQLGGQSLGREILDESWYILELTKLAKLPMPPLLTDAYEAFASTHLVRTMVPALKMVIITLATACLSTPDKIALKRLLYRHNTLKCCVAV